MPNPKYDDAEWDRRLGKSTAWFRAPKPELAPLLPSAAEQRRERLARGTVAIVCGGPDYLERDSVFAALDRLHSLAPVALLVHGACLSPDTGELLGTDRLADWWARARGVPVEMHPVNSGLWGKAAEAMRHKQMAERGAHVCIAFPGGEGMARQAEHYGVEVWRPAG